MDLRDVPRAVRRWRTSKLIAALIDPREVIKELFGEGPKPMSLVEAMMFAVDDTAIAIRQTVISCIEDEIDRRMPEPT